MRGKQGRVRGPGALGRAGAETLKKESAMNGSAMVLVRVGCLGAFLWASVAFAGERDAAGARGQIGRVRARA